ncbi:MAG: hypothetical protein GY778_29745, partial [bacterium]|nr:hypothetical protein [bacterium]
MASPATTIRTLLVCALAVASATANAQIFVPDDGDLKTARDKAATQGTGVVVRPGTHTLTLSSDLEIGDSDPNTWDPPLELLPGARIEINGDGTRLTIWGPLKIHPGARFVLNPNDAVTEKVHLAIRGHLAAGPHQIFEYVLAKGNVSIGSMHNEAASVRWWADDRAPFARATAANARGLYDMGQVTVSGGVASLTGGTWPSWAGSKAILTIGATDYQVQTRLSDTQVSLDDPLATVSGSVDYTLTLPGALGLIVPAGVYTVNPGTPPTRVIDANMEVRPGARIIVAENKGMLIRGSIDVRPGARFEIKRGATLTIAGPLRAGPYKVFDYKNAEPFSTGSIEITPSGIGGRGAIATLTSSAQWPAWWSHAVLSVGRDTYTILSKIDGRRLLLHDRLAQAPPRSSFVLHETSRIVIHEASNDVVLPQWWGAVCANGADPTANHAAIQRAARTCRGRDPDHPTDLTLRFPARRHHWYQVDDTIDLRGIRSINMETRIGEKGGGCIAVPATFAGTAIRVGGAGGVKQYIYDPRIKVGVRRPPTGSTLPIDSSIGIEINDIAQGTLELAAQGFSTGVYIVPTGTGGDISNLNVHLGEFLDNRIGLHLRSIQTAVTNECNFYAGRFWDTRPGAECAIKLSGLSAKRGVNSNWFLKPTFQLDSGINGPRIITSSDNIFVSARFEGAANIAKFEGLSSSNEVQMQAGSRY